MIVTLSQKKEDPEYEDDRNVGRVVNAGGDSMLITGKKADGRYIVVGKKGEKSARDAADLGVTKKEEVVGIDIDDLHQEMLEGLKQARKSAGMWALRRRAVKKSLTVSKKKNWTRFTRASTVSLRKNTKTVALTAARWSQVNKSSIL